MNTSFISISCNNRHLKELHGTGLHGFARDESACADKRWTMRDRHVTARREILSVMQKGQKTQSKRQGNQLPEASQRWVWLVVAQMIDKLAATVGVPMTVFLLMLGVIYGFGKPETRDAFIREVLFQSVTHTPYVQLFFAFFAVGIVVLAIARCRGILSDKAELTRIRSENKTLEEIRKLSDEKSKQQEALLGTALPHTNDPGEES